MPRATLHHWADLPLEKVTEMVTRKVINSPRQVLAQLYLKKGALVPMHQHGGGQMVYVLQGAVRMQVDGVDHTVREGDVLQIDVAAPHQAEALDDTFLVSVTTV